MAVYSDNKIDEDWNKVLPILLQIRSGGPGFEKSEIKMLKDLHSYLYGLAIWSSRLCDISPSGKPYLDSLAVSGVHILSQVALGSKRGASLFMRSMIEDALRYAYFKDHPIEFIKGNSAEKWYVGFEELHIYLNTHPLLDESAVKWDICARLKSEYSMLSEWVHARTVDHLDIGTTLSDINFSVENLSFTLNSIKNMVPSIHLLMICLNSKDLRCIIDSEYRIIRRHLPSAARKLLTRLE
tara:strand:- start:136 stop:855 length:720 start_codon:yes stop_codon:yes gene_type:complete